MIRLATPSDLQRLQELWLYTLINAHPSVPRNFWQDRRKYIQRNLQLADTCLVYTETQPDLPEGFALLLSPERLEYLCVSPARAGQGAGSALMRGAKRGRPQLQAAVLEENLSGRYFLQQQGFVEMERQPCAGAGQAEIVMRYRAECSLTTD